MGSMFASLELLLLGSVVLLHLVWSAAKDFVQLLRHSDECGALLRVDIGNNRKQMMRMNW